MSECVQEEIVYNDLGEVRMFVAVSIKQRYPGHARQAGHMMLQGLGNGKTSSEG